MRRKLAGLFIFVVLALIFVLLRITAINATDGAQYSQQVLSNMQSKYTTSTLPFKRGDIVDRNGTVLATSEKRYNLILDCKVANSNEKYMEPTVRALNEFFGGKTDVNGTEITEASLQERLTSEDTRTSMYQVLTKDLTVEEKQAWDDYIAEAYLDEDERTISDEEATLRKRIAGVWFEEEYVRTYPLGSLACDVIGFTYGDNEASWGIEGYYTNTLNGTDGRKYGYWDTTSEIEQTIVDPVDGNTVQSTIDVNVQQVCEEYIAAFEEEYKDGPYSNSDGAKNIGVVVMNPNDGSILAMASSDPYDLNKPYVLPGEEEEKDPSELTDKDMEELNELWRNYCISDTFEPGSTYKPITVAAALEDASLTGDETFLCDGYEEIAGTTIRCVQTEGHGELTLGGSIAMSCNDALMQIASSLGASEYAKYQSLFNFGTRTGIDLPGEATGIIRNADTMAEVDLATASFGQGFTVTMVQQAAALSALANGGYYYVPHVVSSVRDSDGNLKKTYDSTLVRQVVSTETADLVKSYMREVVTSGTGTGSALNGYSSGAKTGTAQKIPRGNGKYTLTVGSFVPYDDPQVLIYVVVDEPNTDYKIDSRYAQYLGRDILRDILPYLGIYPDQETDGSDEDFYLYDFNNIDGVYGKSEADDAAADEEQAEGAEGELSETVSDTNVPVPQGEEDPSNTAGGNNEETDGVTNEDAGFYLADVE